jgi:hypothetical protein
VPCSKTSPQNGREFREIKRCGVRLFADFGSARDPGMMAGKSGRSSITTQILRARATASAWVWIAAVAVPLMLIAPALWNGYPLLQYDTGGYLARWYEGYLVPAVRRCSGSTFISARIRSSGSISGFRRWRRSGSCS